MTGSGRVILMTDHPWPDIGLESEIIGNAGHRLVTGGFSAGSEDEVVELVEQTNPEAILTCWAPISARAIAAPTRLVSVGRIGVGLDNIDVNAATRRGAWVTNVPDYCVGEVSDHALALALSFLRGVVAGDRDTKANGWHVPSISSPRLAGLAVAIMGYGRIGRETARKFRGLGCRVLVCDPFVTSVADGEEIVDMIALQERAEVIVLHVPLTSATQDLIGSSFLARCARRPLIVNVSRGGLVDNAALYAALEAGTVRGAALDVVEGEPSPPSSILRHPNVIVTPHVAYRSDASMIELRQRACEEAVRLLGGERPRNPVNLPVGAA